MHMAHAAANAEVWLALREPGPAASVTLADWWTGRAGWQECPGPGGYGGTRRLTPGAVAHVQVDAPNSTTGTATLFIEVDLSSITQTLLKDKVARYLAYAADRAWGWPAPQLPADAATDHDRQPGLHVRRGTARLLAHQDTVCRTSPVLGQLRQPTLRNFRRKVVRCLGWSGVLAEHW
jgi:Replication-relaxation